MDSLIDYLDRIEPLIKQKEYDEAWRLANEGLHKIKTEDRYMMYYQMAIILAKEKSWFDALEKMGFVIHHLGGLRGATHKKFVLRLLKKFEKEAALEEYVNLAMETKPKNFAIALTKLTE